MKVFNVSIWFHHRELCQAFFLGNECFLISLFDLLFTGLVAALLLLLWKSHIWSRMGGFHLVRSARLSSPADLSQTAGPNAHWHEQRICSLEEGSIMSEERTEHEQECIHYYCYISMQAFNLLVVPWNKEMQRKCSLRGSKVQSSLAHGVRQHRQPCRALAWRDKARPALLRKDETTIYRDFSLGLSQAHVGAESVLPGTYCSVFGLKQLFPHFLCSSLSFLLSAAI